MYNRNEVSIFRCFWDICQNSILTSWPWTKVKGHGNKRKPIYGFLYVNKRNELSISRCFGDISENCILPLDLGPRSKVMAPNESPYLVPYISTLEMKSLSLIVFEIFAKIALWPLDFGPRSKVMTANKSPFMVSCMSVIEMKSLLSLFSRYLRRLHFDLLTSYMSIIEMKWSLYLSSFLRYLRK